MKPEHYVQMIAVTSLGLIGVVAVIFAGLAFLWGNGEPTALVAVAAAIPAYLAGLLSPGKPNPLTKPPTG